MLEAKKIQQLNCLVSPQRNRYHQNTYTIKSYFPEYRMSLAWAVKNGDLDQVKEMVEGKVDNFFSLKK